MGAIFFYICVFFVGYYSSNVLNMLTVRPIVTNRYIAALFPVYGIAMAHAYMIATRPLPPGKDVTVESALLEFVVLPIVVVTMGAVYFMWNSKGNREEHDTKMQPSAVTGSESTKNVTAQPEQQNIETQPETHATTGEKEETKQ